MATPPLAHQRLLFYCYRDHLVFRRHAVLIEDAAGEVVDGDFRVMEGGEEDAGLELVAEAGFQVGGAAPGADLHPVTVADGVGGGVLGVDEEQVPVH